MLAALGMPTDARQSAARARRGVHRGRPCEVPAGDRVEPVWALARFVIYLVEAGEIADSPMARTKPPPCRTCPCPVWVTTSCAACWRPAREEASRSVGTRLSSVCFPTAGCGSRSGRTCASRTLISARTSPSSSAWDAAGRRARSAANQPAHRLLPPDAFQAHALPGRGCGSANAAGWTTRSGDRRGSSP